MEPNETNIKPKGEEDPTPTEETPPRTFTEDEVNQRLRGMSKELEKAKSATSELEEIKAAQAEADRKAAEEKGEFQRLYEEHQRKATDLDKTLTKKTKRLEALEELLTKETTAQIDKIENKDLRKQVKVLLEGRDVMDQRLILSTFLAANPNAQPVVQPKGGAPGKAKAAGIDDKLFSQSKEYRIEAALAALKDK